MPLKLDKELHSNQRPRNRGGGALGVNAPPLFVPGEKVPFFGKVPYFHRIKVPFMQNLSAIFGQCPLTFKRASAASDSNRFHRIPKGLS